MNTRLLAQYKVDLVCPRSDVVFVVVVGDLPVEPVSSHQAVQTLPVTEDMAQQTTPDMRHMTAQTAAADIGHLAVQTDKQLRAATGESSSMTTEPCGLWSDQVTRRNEDIEDMFLASGEKLELEKKRLAELESKFKSEAEARLEALSVHSDRISALERKQVQLIGYIDDKEQELLPSQSERVTPIGKSGSEESLLSLKGAGKRVRKNSSSQSPEGSGRETTPPPRSAHPCSSAEVPSGMTPSRAKTPPKFRTSPIAESVTARLYKSKNGRRPEETDGSPQKKPASKQNAKSNDHTTSSKSDPVRPTNKSSVSPDGPKSPSHGRLAVPGLQRSFSTKLHLSSSNLASVPESSGEMSEAPEELSSSLPELSQSLPTSQYFDMISEQPRCHSHANLSLPPHDDVDTVSCAGQPSSSETRVTAPVHPNHSVPYHISSKCSQHHDPSMRKAKSDASPLSYHVALKSLRGPSNTGRDRPPAEGGQRCDNPVSPVAKATPARKVASQSKESSASTIHAPVQWNSSTRPSVPTKACKHDPVSTMRSQRGDGKDRCSKSQPLHPTGRTVTKQMSPRLGDMSPRSSGVSKQDTLLDYLASHRLPLDSVSVNANQTTKGRSNENKPQTDITRTLPEVGEEHWSVDRLRTLYPATHIESPDVIPRIAVPDITSSSPLKTHRSDGDQDSVQSSMKRDGSPVKEHKQKRRRSADIPVEIYIPGGVPISKRGGHSPQEADALFFDFTDSMQGLTGHVVMETPFGTPPGEMIVTDDWTKVIRRHGQKATDQQDKTHVHHTPAMVTARMTTGGSPFSAASSKHIWPTLADDYVSILDLKAEQMKDSEMAYRQSADQCTRSSDRKYTVPRQQKYFVPTDRQSNVPTDHKHTAPTNHEHTMPTGHEHTMSGDRHRHSMPSNHQHTVPTGHKHTMPTNHHHTVPVDHEHALPTDCHHSVSTEHIAPVDVQHTVPNQSQYPVQTGDQHTIPNHHQHTVPNECLHTVPTDLHHILPTDDQHTVPTDGQHTVPTASQHTVPMDCQHTVPDDGQHIVPAHGQHTVPTASQHTVPTVSQHTVPMDGQHTVPADGQHMVPTDGQHTVPVDGQHMVPTDGQHTVPADGQHMVPTDGQHTVPDDGQHTVPADGQHMVPTDGQHTVPADGQHMVPTDGQHTVPVDGQHTVPADGQHMVPTDGQHTVPVDGQHTVTADGQHMVPTDGQHTVPVDGQHMVPTDGQHTVPADGQHMVPTDGQHTVPVDGQHTVPADGQHMVPTDGQHTVSSDGQCTVPFDSQHTVPTDGQNTAQSALANSQQTGLTYSQHMVPNDGQHMVVPNDGQHMVVPNDGQHMVVLNDGQHMVVPNDGQHTVASASQGHKAAALSLLPGDSVVQGDNFTDDSLDEDIRQVVTNVTPQGKDDMPCSEPVTETQSRVCLTDAAAAPQQNLQHESQQIPHHEPQQRLQHEPHQEPQQTPQHEPQQTPHQEPQQRPQYEPQQATQEEPQKMLQEVPQLRPFQEPQLTSKEGLQHKPQDEPQQDESQHIPQKEQKQKPQEPQQRPSEEPLDTAPVQASVHALHQVAPPTEPQPPLPTSPLRVTHQTAQQSAPQQPQQRQTDMPPFSDDSLNDNSDQPASDTVLVSSGRDQPSITITPVGNGVTTTVVTPGELSQKHTACEHPVTSPPTWGQTVTTQPAVDGDMSVSVDGPLDTEELPTAETRQVIKLSSFRCFA